MVLKRSLPAGVAALALLCSLRAVPAAEPPAAKSDASAPAAQEPNHEATLEELTAMAAREGLRGRVHGANQELGTYVFTWRQPGNFFHSFDFSLAPANPQVEAVLAGLERHQEVLVKGRLIRNPSSQPHLLAESVEPGKKWDPGISAAREDPPPTDLRRALRGRRELRALVHALAEDGGMLVVEWRGQVIPVQVPPDAELREEVGKLFRGDRIEFRFAVAKQPPRPLHLALDPDRSRGREPLVVTDRIHDLHDQERTMEGELVWFPKSPVLNRAIWGLRDPDPKGDRSLDRYFTLFNFEDMKDQEKIEAALQAAWESQPGGVVNARNKYVNTRVRVRATGKINDPAPNQANPTIVTTSVQVQVLGQSARR